jgi:opacity protein-like surface antigen
MKKTLSLLVFLAVGGMASAPAQAASHYVSGMAGVSWMQNMDAINTYSEYSPHYDAMYALGSGINLIGAVGCDYGNYRIEGELGYQNNDLKSMTGIHVLDQGWEGPVKGDIAVVSILANGYYDFDLGSKVQLYATAGVGAAQISFNNVGTDNVVFDDSGVYSNEETALAWQIGAGFAVPIADHVKLDLRYRYFATTDVSISSESFFYQVADFEPIKTNVSSHSVLLGLRVDI